MGAILKTVGGAVMIPLCLVIVGMSMAAETIKGRVAEVAKDAVKVKTDGEWLPTVGDRAEICLEIPGVPEGAAVAEGKVTAVADDAISVKVDRTFTVPERNHLVRIISEKPQKRPPAAAGNLPPRIDDKAATLPPRIDDKGKALPLRVDDKGVPLPPRANEKTPPLAPPAVDKGPRPSQPSVGTPVVPAEPPPPGSAERRPPPVSSGAPAEALDAYITVTKNPPAPDSGPVASPQSAAAGNVAQLLARGHELCAQGKLVEAQQVYQQAVRAQPTSAEAHYGLATAFNFGGNLDGAIAAYQALLGVAPQTPDIRAWIGQVYLHKGDPNAALQWINQEITANPKSAFAHSLAGSVYLETGDAANRDRAFAAAMSIDPGIAGARHRHGNVFYNHRQFRRAVTDFVSAAYMTPTSSGPALGAGLAYAALGQKQAAIQWFQRYLQMEPKGEWADRARQELQRLREQP